MNLQTMTSLEAQRNFGYTLDSSQRDPVIITRRGRPYSAVISAKSDPKDDYMQYLMVLSALRPLRGEAASGAIQEMQALFGDQAERDGVTEEDVTRWVKEARADINHEQAASAL